MPVPLSQLLDLKKKIGEKDRSHTESEREIEEEKREGERNRGLINKMNESKCWQHQRRTLNDYLNKRYSIHRLKLRYPNRKQNPAYFTH